ncbi:MAG: heme-copper oxidase subunit III [Chloroflexi bacterium]|nr:heme-copper oxidase subunit III [Chloroflexota bacterium]
MERSEAIHPTEPWPGVTHRKLGTWLFLVTEIMLFSGLIGTYLAVRSAGGLNWPSTAEILGVNLAAINTFILIMSSVTMVLSFASIEQGKRAGLVRNLLFTTLLGLTFLGIKVREWSELLHEGYAPNNSLFAATYFTLTGFHAAHVAGGILVILFVMTKALRGGYSAEDHEGVELVGLYWHFVDIVWIFLFTIIYLI